MKTILSAILLLNLHIGYGQEELSEQLSQNNVNASLSNLGNFFHNTDVGIAGYEYPKGGMNHLIYYSTFWYGALDGDGNLRMSVDIQRDSTSFFSGPIKNDGSAEAPEVPFGNEIYLVTKEEIYFHILNHDDFGYVMPFGIENWPGNGDVGLGLANHLAPFEDLDGDGVYEPELGEYPLIKGDKAAYLIMNDSGYPTGLSESDSLGIELHYMFYQYEGDGDINNTTFIHLKIINRSSDDFSEFIVGTYLDVDIGLYSDDYIGTNPDHKLIYGYNGDGYDEGGAGGQPGYGDEIPAVGLMNLNNRANVGGTFGAAGLPSPFPIHTVDYWNYMHARWPDGTHFKYGGNGYATESEEEVNFLFTGSPIPGDESEWNQSNAGIFPSDKSAFMALDPINLNSGESVCYDYAVIVSDQNASPSENAYGLFDVAVNIQEFFDEQVNTYCDFYYLNTPNDQSLTEFNVYPNPSLGTFTVDITGQFDLEIYSMDGRLLHTQKNQLGQSPISTSLNSGTYLVLISQNGNMRHAKLIIE